MRIKLLIMNLIYIVVSGVCIFLLLTQTFININLGYTISRDIFRNAIGSSLDVDTNEIIDEKGIKLDIQAKVSSKMCFSTAFASDPYPYVKNNILDENLDGIAATIKEPLAKLDKIATIKGVSAAIKASICADIYKTNGSSNPEEFALNAGINDEYIENLATTFYSKLEVESAVYSTCMADIYDGFDAMYDMLAAKDSSFASKDVTNERKIELDSEIANPLDILGWLGDDYKILGIDESLCVLLGKVLGLDSENSHSGDEPEPLLLNRVNAEQESSSKFADLVKELIYEKIDEFSVPTGWAFKITGFVHIFIVGAWALLALFCLIKSIFKNPGIFFGLIFWLNLIIQLFLGIIFVFVVPLLRNFVGMIPFIGAQIATFIKPFTFTIASSATIPAFCSIAIFITSFLYRHWKRKRKDEI